MNAVWEPITFEVGDRVRVRISPECQEHAKRMEPKYIEWVQGQTGTVIEWGKHAWMKPIHAVQSPGHCYAVRVDQPWPDGRNKIIVSAAEIVPLPADTSSPADEQGVRP